MNLHCYWELSVSITEWIRKKLTIRQTGERNHREPQWPALLKLFLCEICQKKDTRYIFMLVCQLLFRSATSTPSLDLFHKTQACFPFCFC